MVVCVDDSRPVSPQEVSVLKAKFFLVVFASLWPLANAAAQSSSNCLNTDLTQPITWSLPTLPEGSSWVLSSHAYTLSDDIIPQPEKVPFTMTFWRRAACPTQLIATLDMSDSALTIGVFGAFEGGTSSPVNSMIVNDPAVYGLGNLLVLGGAPPPPGTISGVVNFTLDNIDASQALTIDFTPISISGPESVVSVQIPAASTQPFAIGPGITGNWFDPGQSGHGFGIEVLPGNQLFAQWYVFDAQGHRDWIIGVGPITGNTATVTAAHTEGSGAYFPPNFDPNQIQNTLWGTISFTFTDCNNGTASWQPVEPGYTPGSIPITRLTAPLGLSCP
jgi:hypothetical protein